MSIFLLLFYPDGNLNKIDHKIDNNNKIDNNINNNNKRKIINNEKYPDYYKELKKDLEMNPFFLTF